ncbi:WSC domain-containing protein, partial [Pseudomassariella vexata]
LLLFTLLLLTITPTQAADLNIFDSSSTYHYAGCWNETTEIPNTEGLRALAGGSSEQVPVTMTVPLCLNYCAGNNTAKTQYRVAGLEYSRECWCADELSSLSVKLDDADCNTACDGDNTTACGGALRLSLYNLT